MIELHDDHEGAITAMLRFMYGQAWNVEVCNVKDLHPIMLAVHVFAVGEKYVVHDLNAIAKREVKHIDVSLADIDSFTDAIECAYNNTSDPLGHLRDAICYQTLQKAETLLVKQEYFKFIDMIKRTPAFGIDIARAAVSKAAEDTELRESCQLYVCGTCFKYVLANLEIMDKDESYDCLSCYKAQKVSKWLLKKVVDFDEIYGSED